MPLVWNCSPYDLDDGAGTTVLSGITRSVAASDWVTAAILAGLLVIADGDHTATTGLGNPAQTQTAPALTQLPPTASDGKTVPAGSELPVDATHAARTVIVPPARVSIVCGYSKIDNSGNAVQPAPHDTDTIIPARFATLTGPQTAIRLFGYTGGWVAVRYDPDAIAGAKTFTQVTTMTAGQVVAGGSTVSGGSIVTGGSSIAGGATVTGGQKVTGGQTVAGGTTTDTLTVNGATTASGLVTATKGAKITGGLTADTATIGPWQIATDPYGNPALIAASKNAALAAGSDGLYVIDAKNTRAASLHAAGWDVVRDSFGNTAILSGSGGTGVVSQGGVLYVVQAGNTGAHAPLTAAALNADGVMTSGSIQTGVITSGQHNMGSAPIYCGDVHGIGGIFTAGVTVNGGMSVGAQINLAGNIAMGYNAIYCGDIHAQNVYCVAVNPSDRRAKTSFRPVEQILGKSAVRAVLDAPATAYRVRDDVPELAHLTGRDHIGPIAQDLPATAQVPDGPGGYLGVSQPAVVGILWAAVEELAGERVALRDTVDDLVARLERLESGAAAS